MSSMREFFEREAGDYIDRIDRLMAELEAGADAAELHRLARGLRGSAQMAREGRVQEVAGAMEAAARALSGSTLEWTPDVADRLRHTLDDLVALIMADGTPEALESRVAAAVQRWQALGVEPLFVGVGSAVPAGLGERPEQAQEWRDFFRYAAEEGAAIAAELQDAVRMLESSPDDRRPLAAVVRRQRALLGAADADRLGALGEVLRDIAEVARSTASDDGPVASEVIDYLKSAHALVQEAIPWLERGETPGVLSTQERLDELRPTLAEGTSGPPPEAQAASGLEEEFPVEVLNFFRSEADLILDRLARIAGDIEVSDTQSQGPLEEDAHDALAALRDTALTFGFDDVARLAARTVEETSTGATSLANATVRLRRFMVERGVLDSGHGLPEAGRRDGATTEAERREVGTEAEPPGRREPEAPEPEVVEPAWSAAPVGAIEPRADGAAAQAGIETIPEREQPLGEVPRGSVQEPVGPAPQRDLDAPAGAEALAAADQRRTGRVSHAPVAEKPADRSAVARSVGEGGVEGDGTAGTPAREAADLQPIEDFLYRGESALRRALELRAGLERLAAGRPEAQALVGELFELIELARS